VKGFLDSFKLLEAKSYNKLTRNSLKGSLNFFRLLEVKLYNKSTNNVISSLILDKHTSLTRSKSLIASLFKVLSILISLVKSLLLLAKLNMLLSFKVSFKDKSLNTFASFIS